jgi:hypothetical protein
MAALANAKLGAPAVGAARPRRNHPTLVVPHFAWNPGINIAPSADKVSHPIFPCSAAALWFVACGACPFGVRLTFVTSFEVARERRWKGRPRQARPPSLLLADVSFGALSSSSMLSRMQNCRVLLHASTLHHPITSSADMSKRDPCTTLFDTGLMSMNPPKLSSEFARQRDLRAVSPTRLAARRARASIALSETSGIAWSFLSFEC